MKKISESDISSYNDSIVDAKKHKLAYDYSVERTELRTEKRFVDLKELKPFLERVRDNLGFDYGDEVSELIKEVKKLLK